MRRSADNDLVFSATDLANHLACEHLTQLGVQVANGALTKPFWTDERLELLRQRGNEIEIEDLDTRNGTYVNGSAIQSTTLHSGDKIRLADVDMVYEK